MKRITLPLIFILALPAASLVSCASTSAPTAGVNIVATTNVYGSIAQEIAGPHATVTSIIDSPSQDPHAFEAGARVQLELSRADVVIANGGGYDDFVNRLLAGSDNSAVEIITAVDISGFTEAQISDNEHVWYDLDTAQKIAEQLGADLARIDPDHAVDYQANVEAFTGSLSKLSDRVAALADAHKGNKVMVTEPVPLYLLTSAGFVDVTPTELSAAIENGIGVPPAVLNAALTQLGDGTITLLVYNEQTEGPETQQLIAAATTHGIPVIGVTETIPNGLSYLEWMAANITALEVALR